MEAKRFFPERSPTPDRKIRVGIAAMEKKARSKPMNQIMRRFDPDIFEFIIFGDQVLLHEPVERWPIVDYLFAWHSTNYPLHKAEKYVNLRQPYVINDVSLQHELLDRRRVYAILKENDIPTPRHVILEDHERSPETLKECDDWIEVKGVRFDKPVVEKPVDAEDHNIYIYYPMSAGGGSKRLFRKVGNKSSDFYPEENEVRKKGSYIYEEFMKTQGVDVKVYTVGPNYGHAEARKSPVVDGKVNRNFDGSEVRYPVLLSTEEKHFANKVCTAFKQAVCGFDILRVNEKSYVCDVNGWSFVKSSHKYFDDCAQLLSEIMISTVQHKGLPCKSAVAPLITHRHMASHLWEPGTHVPLSSLSHDSQLSPGSLPQSHVLSPGTNVAEGKERRYSPSRSPSRSPTTGLRNSKPRSRDAAGDAEELRCVIGVIRHGDRTPKQKLKFVVELTDMLDGDRVFEPYFTYFRDMVAIDQAESTPTQGAKETSKTPPRANARLNPEDMTSYSRAEGTTYSKREGQALADAYKQSATTQAAEAEGAKTPERQGRVDDTAAAHGPPGSEVKARRRMEVVSGAGEAVNDTDGSPTTLFADIQRDSGSPPNNLRGQSQKRKGKSREKKGKKDKDKKKAKGAKSTKVKSKDGLKNFLQITETIFAKLHAVQDAFEQECELCASADERSDYGELYHETEPLSPSTMASRKQAAGGSIPRYPSKGKLAAMLTPNDRKESFFVLPTLNTANGQASEPAVPMIRGTTVASLLYQLQQIRDVLGRGQISGLTRKLQIKAQDWAQEGEDCPAGVVPGTAIRLQIILKWGGALTPLGEAQAQWLGEALRKQLYPDPKGGGVLRLHSTFRHDLKIKTSDEGRVMKTAAAFTKGMLQLEGSLIPILMSLVRKEKEALHMLDPTGNDEARAEVDRCKEFLNMELQRDQSLRDDLINNIAFDGQRSVLNALRALGNPRRVLMRMYTLIRRLVEQLEVVVRDIQSGVLRPIPRLYMDETPLLMLDRWRKLHKDLYDEYSQSFDLTKVPDVHDNIRYDVEHNLKRLPLAHMHELHELAKRFADCYVPQEYGRTEREKLRIGTKMCLELLNKIKYDLILGTRDDSNMDMHYMLDPAHAQYLDVKSLARRVRTRLYFTSESHLHTLVNVLRFMPLLPGGKPVIDEEGAKALSSVSELCYLTHIVIRVFENSSKPLDSPNRFRVELGFSPGADRPPAGLSQDPNEVFSDRPLSPLAKKPYSQGPHGSKSPAPRKPPLFPSISWTPAGSSSDPEMTPDQKSSEEDLGADADGDGENAAQVRRKDSFGAPSKFFENSDPLDTLSDIPLLRVTRIKPLNKSMALSAEDLEACLDAAIQVGLAGGMSDPADDEDGPSRPKATRQRQLSDPKGNTVVALGVNILRAFHWLFPSNLRPRSALFGGACAAAAAFYLAKRRLPGFGIFETLASVRRLFR